MTSTLKKTQCQICGKEGRITQFPGPVPYTGCWCENHLDALRVVSNKLEKRTQDLAKEENLEKNITNYSWVILVQTENGWQEKSRYNERCWAIGNAATAIVKTGIDHIIQIKKKNQ